MLLFFKKIIDKDLKCGCGVKVINNAYFKGGIPEHHWIPTFDCMAAHLYTKNMNKVNWEDEWYGEPKKDGMRCVYFIGDSVENTVCYSRGGKEIETLSDITKEIVSLYPKDSVIDGEVITPGVFEDAMSTIRRLKENAKPGEIYFHPFAVLTIDEWDNQECNATYKQIRERLHKEDTNFIKKLPSKLLKSEQEAFEYYEECINNGDEGVMLKKGNGVYEFKRSNNQLKLKSEKTVDVKVIGYYEGEKNTKNEGRLGGFIVEYFGSKGRVEVRVGGGFKEKDPTEDQPDLINQRQKFWDEKEDMLGAIIEVEYMEETSKGSLRHPRFCRLRSFKNEKI